MTRPHPDTEVIGLSLSFCVPDIVAGHVHIDDVDKIISGTLIETREEFEQVIERYQQVYWRDRPEESRAVALALWDSGRVEQPRMQGKMAHSVSEGHWRIGGHTIRHIYGILPRHLHQVGIYSIYPRSGGRFYATVGATEDGGRWIAAPNWVSGSSVIQSSGPDDGSCLRYYDIIRADYLDLPQ